MTNTMNNDKETLQNAIIATTTAITSAVSAVSAVFATAANDGRSNWSPIAKKCSNRTTAWYVVENDNSYDEGWYHDQFRCSKQSFDTIHKTIEEKWSKVLIKPRHNSYFGIRHHVAVTLHFLTHSGSMGDAATIFGMSWSSASRYIWQVIKVIREAYPIKLPTSLEEWHELRAGMEARKGFPHAYLAVDGTLIKIERPYDYEGWYCRKGYPAFNVQVVVDHTMRICDFDVRPGSASDKQIFSNSYFGQNIHKLLPKNGLILADAGYTLMYHVMTPYSENDDITLSDRLYNFIHLSS